MKNKEELFNKLKQLTPAELQKVLAFAQNKELLTKCAKLKGKDKTAFFQSL